MDSLRQIDTNADGALLPGRVLVVAGDTNLALEIEGAVQGLGKGWSTHRVFDGEECLGLLETATFSVLLLDTAMAGQNGLELFRRIKAMGYTVPVVVIAEKRTERAALDAFRAGVIDYVIKDRHFAAYLPLALSRAITQHRKNLENITAHSRLRLQLAQQTERRILDSFVAPIVHDIKSPLSSIVGANELLLSSVGHPVDPSVQHLIAIVQQAAGKIDDLVNQLLKFAFQEVEERVPVDLTKMLADVADREVQALTFRNIRLVRNIPDREVCVCAALKTMEQVFLNLLANAAEATVVAGGGVIKMALQRDETMAIVTVSDNGPGIDPDRLECLFDPFSLSCKPHGSGLGLAIVAGIVREHGGQVQVENLPERGAKFTVRLPLESHRLTALVLEDDSCVSKIIASQLDFFGIRADIYDDGEKVIRVLERGRWDLALLDIRIPGTSGIDVFLKIAELRPELVRRTVVVSGAIADTDMQRLLVDYPLPCLLKPYTPDQFNDTIRLLLRGA